MEDTPTRLERKATAIEFEPVPTEEDGEASHSRCGLGRWKPRWLQRFADPKVYLVVFSAVGVLEGAYFTYFVGVLSTLEKRFAFDSKVAGMIFIADNISAGLINPLVGYYGAKWHKPRALAFGMFMVSVSCFLCTVPYFLEGPALHLLTREDVTGGGRRQEFCGVATVDGCEGGSGAGLNGSITAIVILFIANFLWGFGYAAFYTIGTPYLDDNVRKKNAPMYFSVMGSLRLSGPTLGFLLSSFCLKFYEDPFHEPGIGPRNPRWVGAWWMGFFLLGISIFVCSCLLLLFPRELPARFQSETKQAKKENELPKLKEFPKALNRLMKNPIFMCHAISIVLQVNGFAGYFVFLPKFMESQYKTSASEASLFSGSTGTASMLLGMLLGGFLIQKFKPRPRYLTGSMFFVELFFVFGLFISIFLGCDPLNMPGTSPISEEPLNLFNECNAGCGCTRAVFEPVCGPDGVSTFFSPCFAGCPNTTTFGAANKTVFEDCACASVLNSTFTASSVTSGFCKSTCKTFWAFIIVLFIGKFVSSTVRVGNTLISYRCVDAKDKAFAAGVSGSFVAIFGFIPYPMIYGALTDSACLVWEEKCGKTGNCWLYDTDKFRLYLHGMSIAFISLGLVFDAVVFFLSGRLTDFYGEEDDRRSTETRFIKGEDDISPRKDSSALKMDVVM